MAPNEISVAVTRYPHTRSLHDGLVKAEGMPLEFVDIEGKLIETFRKMSREMSFGISELGISTALIARDLGMPIKLLPVFPTRRFDHEAIFVNKNKIRFPRDLVGARIGLRSYTVTDAVWSRAVLSEVYSIDLSSITWVVTADEHIEGSRLPSNVEHVQGDLDFMIESGEIEATLNPYRGASDDIDHLVPDFLEAEREWYRTRNYVPIHHVIVVRDDILEQYPKAPGILFGAFDAAKSAFLTDIRGGHEFPELDMRHVYGVDCFEDRYSSDPVPYGLETNQQALRDLVHFAKDQKIINDHWQVEDLFLPV